MLRVGEMLLEGRRIGAAARREVRAHVHGGSVIAAQLGHPCDVLRVGKQPADSVRVSRNSFIHIALRTFRGGPIDQ